MGMPGTIEARMLLVVASAPLVFEALASCRSLSEVPGTIISRKCQDRLATVIIREHSLYLALPYRNDKVVNWQSCNFMLMASCYSSIQRP